MSKPYWVSVKEVHIQTYKVVADSPAEAKVIVSQQLRDGVPFEPQNMGAFEYSHHMEPVTWSVETE